MTSYRHFFRDCFFLVCLPIPSVTALSQEVPVPRRPVRNQPPPKIDSDKYLREFERATKYEGLDPSIARRIESELRGSISEIFEVYGAGLTNNLKLDSIQTSELPAAIKKRAKRREDCIRPLYLKLSKVEGEIADKLIKETVDAFKSKDAEHELELTVELENLLDPIQIGKVCKIAMGDIRPDFARVPLVARYLHLTPEQQSKYEACRIAFIYRAKSLRRKVPTIGDLFLTCLRPLAGGTDQFVSRSDGNDPPSKTRRHSKNSGSKSGERESSG